MKYDILFAPYERDDPEVFMDWAIYEEDMSLAEAMVCIAKEFETDGLSQVCGDWAYRLVPHGEWGDKT